MGISNYSLTVSIQRRNGFQYELYHLDGNSPFVHLEYGITIAPIRSVIGLP